LCSFRNKTSRIEKEWAININGKKTTFEKLAKFLELYFEADLKWNHQVEAIRQKFIKPTEMIRYIRTTNLIAYIETRNRKNIKINVHKIRSIKHTLKSKNSITRSH
jgi:hypothetical protein